MIAPRSLIGHSACRAMLLLAVAIAVPAAATPASVPPAPVPPASAAPPAASPAEQSEMAAVAAKLPGAKPSDLRTTPIAGIYEYRRGAEIAYVTADGRYAFAGDLYQLSDNSNLSDVRRRELRRAMIGAVSESRMVVFGPPDPKNVKYTVTVFTDVDCTYCRALHKQIDEYSRLGIRVRYVPFPRSGPASPSWTRAEQVWCATDRNTMLTQAKQSEMYSTLPGKVCSPNPVAEGYALGKSIGLTGTPGIVTESGELLPGFVPPKELLAELKSESLAAAAKP